MDKLFGSQLQIAATSSGLGNDIEQRNGDVLTKSTYADAEPGAIALTKVLGDILPSPKLHS